MKKYQSLRIFENPYLEMLTHVHPIVPLVVWLPILTYVGWRTLFFDGFSFFLLAAMALVGFGFWTLTEYVLHRFVFHFKPKGAWQEKLHFIIHGNHHADPNDPSRLVMPPIGSLILGSFLYAFYRMFLGPVWVDPFFFGFIIGYLSYDYTHYAIHHFRPLTRFGRWNKQHHMFHHFVGHEARWGVSSPFWDYVFNSVLEKEPQPKSSHGAAAARAQRSQDRVTSLSPNREHPI